MGSGRVVEGKLTSALAASASLPAPLSGSAHVPVLLTCARPAETAGQKLADAVSDVLARKEFARLAISGGSALEAACDARARLADEWKRVVLTWADERCVPVASADSNRGAAALRGLLSLEGEAEPETDPLSVVALFEDGDDPRAAIARFGEAWHGKLGAGLDVVLLGMGPDGHVASLFPALRPWPVGVPVAHVSKSPKPPADRITLTREALATASYVVLLATGAEKRDAIRKLMLGDPTLPASGLGNLLVVTDQTLE